MSRPNMQRNGCGVSALRELLARATPGPWVVVRDDYGDWEIVNDPESLTYVVSGRYPDDQDAPLLALAPDLGLLAADMADALDTARDYCARPASVCGDFDALLARYRQLEEKAGQ